MISKLKTQWPKTTTMLLSYDSVDWLNLIGQSYWAFLMYLRQLVGLKSPGSFWYAETAKFPSFPMWFLWGFPGDISGKEPAC